MNMIQAINKRNRERKPVRVGKMDEMEVNAGDQLGRDETGEMMHTSDSVRNRQIQTNLRVKGMIERGEEPGTDTDVEEAGRQGYYDRAKNLGKYAHPPKKK